MSKFSDRLSLSQRLSIPVMSFILLVFIGFQIITYQNYIKIEQDNLLSRTQVLANGVGINLTATVLFEDKVIGNEILAAFKADALIARVRLEKPDHSLFAQYVNKDFSFIPPTSRQQQYITEHGYHFGTEMLYMIVPVMMDGKQIAHMHIAVSLQKLQQMRITQFRISVFLLLILFGISAYIVNRLQFWVIHPISELNQAMTRIIKNEEHVSTRPQAHTRDELGELVDCFNSMLDKLTERDHHLRSTLNQLGEEIAFADDVIETVQHALIVADLRGEITLANDACLDVLGIPPVKAQGMNILEVLQNTQPKMFSKQLRDALDGKSQLDHNLINGTTPTGKKRTYQIVSRPLTHQRQTLFAIEDVTRKQQAERQQQMAAKVFDCSQDAILLLGESGRIKMVNPAFSRFVGYQAEEVIGQPVLNLLDREDYSRLETTIRTALQSTNQWQGEMNQLCKDGSYIPLFVRINKIEDSRSHEIQTVIIASDLRSLKEMQRLEFLATHDPLTNLPNRSKLRQELNHLLARKNENFNIFAVLFIDIDDFKTINDSYGHEIGDKALKIIAERLNRTVRKSDMVARLAGDEFVIVINPVSCRADVTTACKRILSKVGEPLRLSGNIQITTGTSIGCYYVFEDEYQNVEDILRRADKAMYEAKLSGKGKIIEFNQFQQR